MFKLINAKWHYNNVPVQYAEPKVQILFDEFINLFKYENHGFK
jgi:hypothetical protein